MNGEDYWQCKLNEEVYLYRAYIDNLGYEHNKPSVLYKPKLSIDGDKWRALFGANIQDGVVSSQGI